MGSGALGKMLFNDGITGGYYVVHRSYIYIYTVYSLVPMTLRVRNEGMNKNIETALQVLGPRVGECRNGSHCLLFRFHVGVSVLGWVYRN